MIFFLGMVWHDGNCSQFVTIFLFLIFFPFRPSNWWEKGMYWDIKTLRFLTISSIPSIQQFSGIKNHSRVIRMMRLVEWLLRLLSAVACSRPNVSSHLTHLAWARTFQLALPVAHIQMIIYSTLLLNPKLKHNTVKERNLRKFMQEKLGKTFLISLQHYLNFKLTLNKLTWWKLIGLFFFSHQNVFSSAIASWRDSGIAYFGLVPPFEDKDWNDLKGKYCDFIKYILVAGLIAGRFGCIFL